MSAIREFASLGQFAAHLMTRQAAVALELHAGLVEVANNVRDTARQELGTYQKAIGPFPAWAQLKEETQVERVRQGYTANDPLLRSGEMRDSVHREVSALEAVVGSDDDKAVYHELGTDKVPPRPFLGPAVLHCEEKMRRVLGGALVTGIIGRGINVPTLMTSREFT
ncbi:hypothetical protein [Burkholderia vietnamiensis]|uniref:hypothetical protein n=1 Tax=Burkholderia vietnamiensis TaxID=60552 RepID=UPI001FC8B767|nr:hypothetical protein [Burkholderia vietnamiensis]